MQTALSALGLVLLLALGGCGQDPDDEAFRELVGVWQLDSEASLRATLDGNFFTSFLPREEIVEALSPRTRAPLSLRILPDGSVFLEDEASEHVVAGRIEDAGTVFLVHFRFGEATGTDEASRVTLEFRRLEETLHAWVVGAAQGAEGEAAIEMLQYVGMAASVHLVFAAPR